MWSIKRTKIKETLWLSDSLIQRKQLEQQREEKTLYCPGSGYVQDPLPIVIECDMDGMDPSPLPTQHRHTTQAGLTSRCSHLSLHLDLPIQGLRNNQAHNVQGGVLQRLWCPACDFAQDSQSLASCFWATEPALGPHCCWGSSLCWLSELLNLALISLTKNIDLYGHPTFRKFHCFYCIIINVLKIRTLWSSNYWVFI